MGGRSIVVKWGEGGTLTGGVSGSSAVMVLSFGSKKETLVGVDGIVIVWAVEAADMGVRGSGSGSRW